MLFWRDLTSADGPYAMPSRSPRKRDPRSRPWNERVAQKP
jgi:hypothetical protein